MQLVESGSGLEPTVELVVICAFQGELDHRDACGGAFLVVVGCSKISVCRGTSSVKRVGDVAHQGGQFRDPYPERIDAVEISYKSIAGRMLLTLIGAEDAVPDDQDAAIVLVEVKIVAAVMDAVVGRGVEDAVEGAEPADKLRMDPGLVGLDRQYAEKDDFRRQAGEQQRDVADEAPHALGGAEAHAGDDVHVAGGMVHGMLRP